MALLKSVAAAVVVAALPFAGRAQTDTPPPVTPPVTPTPAQPTTPPTPPAVTPHKKPRLLFGPELGLFLPTSSHTKNTFGNSWFNYGLGLGSIQRADARGGLQFDLNIISNTRSSQRAIIAPIGVAYRHSLASNVHSGAYYGASVNYVLTQLRSDNEGILSRVRGTAGGSVFLGTTFDEKAYLQARYYAVGKVRGYDLSGLNLSLGYRF